jgi:WD40 repeat protein
MFLIVFEGAGFDVLWWDVYTEQLVAEFKGHSGQIHSIAFDGRGKYLASGWTRNEIQTKNKYFIQLIITKTIIPLNFSFQALLTALCACGT